MQKDEPHTTASFRAILQIPTDESTAKLFFCNNEPESDEGALRKSELGSVLRSVPPVKWGHARPSSSGWRWREDKETPHTWFLPKDDAKVCDLKSRGGEELAAKCSTIWGSNMTVDEAIKARRSIRRYQDKPVPESDVNHLLDLARYSPSSMNGQPWHFIVIREYRIKKELAEIKNRYCPVEKRSYEAEFLETAPVVIVICVDIERSFGRELENSVLAAANLLLAACAAGLGSVYMSAYTADEPKLAEEIERTLNIPKNVRPIAIIPLGYPDEVPLPKAMRPLKEMIHLERF